MTNPRCSAEAGRELRRMVRINEGIKSVVAAAFKINLMAMNAIFLAKRAGQSALGFGVLSNELRSFAGDLQQQMAALREATSASVAAVTVLVKQSRVSRLLERAGVEAQGESKTLIQELLQLRAETRLAGSNQQMATLNRGLSHMIADTVQLVELGSVLARSAKIEAAYGGGFSVALMQVSSDFEKMIGEIRQSLESLSGTQEEDFVA
ncbi:MAG: chemotaxis protein [Rhodocyclales bacterium]|nr:chemotaxis protein [Rhodocyclales bacterium]